MDCTIFPSLVNDSASVFIPSSKSLSHRALIAASLADHTSMIHHLSHSKDTEATMRVLSHFGVLFEENGEDLKVTGMKSLQDYDGRVLNCGESGSTLRFLIPLFSLVDKEVIFSGQGRLMKRPQSVYEDIFRKNHLLFDFEKDTLHIKGPLPAGDYIVRGDVSSQFISGLLFTLPLLKEDSSIHVLEPFASRSYVGLTVDMLKRAGIEIRWEEDTFLISGEQKYKAFEYDVDGDDSQAAFFALLALVQKKPIQMHHLNHASKQGDAVLYQIVQKLGGCVKEIEDGWKILPGSLHGTTIDLADCPDLGPALFALATQCENDTVFQNAGRLRIKESDRIAAMEEELGKLGCTMTSDEDTVIVTGQTPVHGNVTLNGHNDHRIVMALSALSTIADQPVTITGAEAVAKSYPSFFEDLKKTGVKVV